MTFSSCCLLYVNVINDNCFTDVYYFDLYDYSRLLVLLLSLLSLLFMLILVFFSLALISGLWPRRDNDFYIYIKWYQPPSWKGLNRTTKAYLEWLRKLWWTATLPLIFAVALEFIDCSILNQSPNQSCWHLIFHINIIFQLHLILYLTLKILRLWWFYPPLGYKEKLDGETMDLRRKSTDWLKKHLNTAVLIYKSITVHNLLVSNSIQLEWESQKIKQPLHNFQFSFDPRNFFYQIFSLHSSHWFFNPF